jgi:hypothetical protein
MSVLLLSAKVTSVLHEISLIIYSDDSSPLYSTHVHFISILPCLWPTHSLQGHSALFLNGSTSACGKSCFLVYLYACTLFFSKNVFLPLYII